MSPSKKSKTERYWKHYGVRGLSLDALKGIIEREGLILHSYVVSASLTSKHLDVKPCPFPSGMMGQQYGRCLTITERRLPGSALDSLEADREEASRLGDAGVLDRLILRKMWIQDPETRLVAEIKCKHRDEETPPPEYREKVIKAKNRRFQVGLELTGVFYEIVVDDNGRELMHRNEYPRLKKKLFLSKKDMSRAALMKKIPTIMNSDLIGSVQCEFVIDAKAIEVGMECRKL